MFKRATKVQARLRLALVGPAGAGKTTRALELATTLSEGDPNHPSHSKIALIDTERGSASLYADKFAFDVCELESFEPHNYVEAIRNAEREGFKYIIIDSLSHAWTGKGGALDQVDKASAREKGNSYTAWRTVTPQHNALVDAILGSSAHIICTMRTKTEYVLETNARGKQVPRKVGLAPIQREGLDYEFTVVADLDHDYNIVVGKTRCPALALMVTKEASEIALRLQDWLRTGDVPPALPAPPPASPGETTVADLLEETHRRVQAAITAFNKCQADEAGKLRFAELVSKLDKSDPFIKNNVNVIAAFAAAEDRLFPELKIAQEKE